MSWAASGDRTQGEDQVKGEGWSDGSAGQGTPRMASNHQKLGGLLASVRGSPALLAPGVGLPASRTERQYTVWYLIQQPQQPAQMWYFMASG